MIGRPIAIALMVSASLAGRVNAQLRADPGTVINGRVAVRVYVTLSDDETSYAPIAGVRAGIPTIELTAASAGRVTIDATVAAAGASAAANAGSSTDDRGTRARVAKDTATATMLSFFLPGWEGVRRRWDARLFRFLDLRHRRRR